MLSDKFKYITAVFILLLASGCSLKKNTAFTRQYRAFTTRYNVYFNGKEAYKEALAEMEKSYQDNYAEQIFIHPVSSKANEENPAETPAFDRSIEKSQKAIRLRSVSKRPVKNPRKMDDPAYKEFLKRSEFNPFLHNAWLLMGKSQFYKGDFLAANATFLYITRQFKWLPETVTESQIWMARCYAEMGWLYEAENVLSKIDPQSVPKPLQGWYATTYAAYLLKKGDNKEAIPYLERALKDQDNKAQKVRMKFLLGQLYASADNPVKAYKLYGDVIGMNPNYRTLFNASIKQTEVMPGNDLAKVEKKLTRMARDPRNKEYLDQVFYAQGNLHLQRSDSLKAIDAYQKAVDQSTRSGMEKAIAAIRLGDLTFAREDYIHAQPAYAAAVSILPKKHKEYSRVSRLSEVLDNLMVHAETVHMQDSLLALVALPEAERMAAIQKIIDEIIRKEKEDAAAARREEYQANLDNREQPENPFGNNTMTPQGNMALNGGGDNSWYFYNKTTVNSGKSEFQRRWGSRKPEDNWRRRNKTQVMEDPFANSNSEEALAQEETEEGTETAEMTEEELKDAANPKKPEYYLQQLPFTPEAQANAHDLIQEGLFNMGIIINQQLENLPLSIKTFEDLDRRYPECAHKLDIYYEIYLMYMRLNDIASATVYKEKILSTFPSSGYAVALSDPDYIDNLRDMDKKQGELYEETYLRYLEGNLAAVHSNYEFVREKWPLAKLMPKFLFLHALSYVAENNALAFRESLEQLTALYGTSDVAPMADMMIRGLKDGRALASGAPARGMIWKTRLKGGTFEADTTAVPFQINQDAPHLLVLAFQTDSVNVNELLFNIAKYNFSNYLVKDFDLEVITFNELSMLVIKGFNNFDELSSYRVAMELPWGMDIPAGITPVMISDSNFRLLLEGRSFADYFEFMEAGTVAAVESAESVETVESE